jgi:peptide/nickel transport system substrate-binding protein
VAGDWCKGDAGTGEAGPLYTANAFSGKFAAGQLAESWEVHDANNITIHVREGVHWQDKAPVNGREFTADDVVFELERHFSLPQSYLGRSFGDWFVSAEATDRYTVKLTVNDAEKTRTLNVWDFTKEHMFYFPPEGIDKWGDYRDWRNQIGTGPFMITDFVPGSSATFVRNPNYWEKNECGVGKGDQLPYVDGVKLLDIRDPSTKLAAIRTGKIDVSYYVPVDDGETVLRTNPEIQHARAMRTSVYNLWGRIDTPPFDNVKVRQALAMAVDREGIKEGFYSGYAEILAYPIPPFLPEIYIPVEELPEPARSTFSGDTERAKALLAEAGYPDGFKTEAIVRTDMVDVMSIIKENWKEIGVEVEIQPKEKTVWNSIKYARSHEQMMMITASLGKEWQISHVMPFPYNVGIIDDPYLNERFAKVFDWDAASDRSARVKMAQENVIHLLSQAYVITPPTPQVFTMWQPWVKNFHGEDYVGYHNQNTWPKYIWLDRDLKEEMIGKR